ncbi:MAG TPA: hypothetical protein VK983_03990 [Candidatus Limnocylindrales bacterium]|nr:hypothetical protein [Candidatus Limnocylindrales bacterium]
MRYVAGFVITIFLLIFAFILIFRGGSDAPDPQTGAPQLVSYANTSTEVRLTIDRPVMADQVHRQIVMTVGRDASQLSYQQGYEGAVVRSQTYANNPTAYANFLRALELAGFNKGDSTENLKDERGHCPEGDRYVMEVRDGDRVIQRFWSTSCGNIGSFKGRIDTIILLFQRQIPDYITLTADV